MSSLRLTTSILIALWVMAGCGKSKPADAPAKPAADVAAVGLPAAATPTVDDGQKAKLAKAFGVIRCQVVGAANPDPQVYAAQGFASAAAFAAAFAAAAESDPAWAAEVTTAAHAKPCPGGKVAAPTAPTPTAAPAAGAQP